MDIQKYRHDRADGFHFLYAPDNGRATLEKPERLLSLIPLNFPILMDFRNWVFVMFILFIAGTLVHYVLPNVSPAPVNQGS